jgi:very-short-patch-repair endonuclease
VESIDRPIARKVTPLGVAAAIAGPQHGVVARRQLLRAGLSRDQVDHLVAAGGLILLYRGVYAVGHRPAGPRSREMAVVLLAGPTGALAWQSSAGLWAVTRPWHGPVHALGPKSRSGPGFVIHRTRDLQPGDVTTHWGIPVTTPLRTLLDLSSHLSLDALDAALAEALVRRLVTPEDLQPRATGNLRRLLTTAAPTRSRLERDFRRLLRDHGLPQPISNGIVCGYEVDLHWAEHRLIAELDGYAYHHHRRAFETDRLRDQELLATGWRVARATDWQLKEARRQTAERFSLLLAPARLPAGAPR